MSFFILLADGGLWGDGEADRSVFWGNQQSDGETLTCSWKLDFILWVSFILSAPLCVSEHAEGRWVFPGDLRLPSRGRRDRNGKNSGVWVAVKKRPDPPTFVVEHVRPFTVFSSFRSTARAFIYIFIEAVQDKVHVCNSYCIYSSICVLFSVNILVSFYLEWVQDSSFNVLSCSFFIRGT